VDLEGAAVAVGELPVLGLAGRKDPEVGQWGQGESRPLKTS
jgi:hypothetical protein